MKENTLEPLVFDNYSAQKLNKQLLQAFPASEPVINMYKNEDDSYTVNVIAHLPDKLDQLEKPSGDQGVFVNANKTLFVSYEENLVPLITDINPDQAIDTREFIIQYDADPKSKGYDLYHIEFTYTLSEAAAYAQAIYVVTEQIKGGHGIGDEGGRGTVTTVVKDGPGMS